MPRHSGCESAGMDSKPRVLGGASVSTPRKTPRRVLEVDLRRHAHLAEVGGVADRLELLLGRGVEGIAGALVVGDGVGQHGPRLSCGGSSIHSSSSPGPRRLLSGLQRDGRLLPSRLERVAGERETKGLAEQVGRRRGSSPALPPGPPCCAYDQPSPPTSSPPPLCTNSSISGTCQSANSAGGSQSLRYHSTSAHARSVFQRLWPSPSAGPSHDVR